jgi:hypothetical protein
MIVVDNGSFPSHEVSLRNVKESILFHARLDGATIRKSDYGTTIFLERSNLDGIRISKHVYTFDNVEDYNVCVLFITRTWGSV